MGGWCGGNGSPHKLGPKKSRFEKNPAYLLKPLFGTYNLRVQIEIASSMCMPENRMKSHRTEDGTSGFLLVTAVIILAIIKLDVLIYC